MLLLGSLKQGPLSKPDMLPMKEPNFLSFPSGIALKSYKKQSCKRL